MMVEIHIGDEEPLAAAFVGDEVDVRRPCTCNRSRLRECSSAIAGYGDVESVAAGQPRCLAQPAHFVRQICGVFCDNVEDEGHG